MSKKIVLTGGGTAGHVTPNMALIPTLREKGFEISYIGSYEGIEKNLIEEINIPYYGISSGKLRRYFDLKNFSDPFKVLKGYSEAKKILRQIQPDIVFSKGGFVTVPVVIAAKHLHIPVIIHESDMTPGLANKLAIPAATKVCCNFPETLKHLPNDKAVLTGSPIRQELMTGSKAKALQFLGFSPIKPVVLVMGGSLGSVAINNALREDLDRILERFQIIHLCGEGKTDKNLENKTGYRQFEYIKKELADLLALSDVVISRAGANAICELLALRKPAVLIPLSAAASRGDQILNAKSFAAQGFSELLEEERLTKDSLYNTLTKVYQNKDTYINHMKNSAQTDAVSTITSLIVEHRR